MADRTTYGITDKSAATLASGVTTGTAHLAARYYELNVYFDVTAVSGVSPTLDAVIQSGPASDGPFATVATFTQVTGTGDYLKSVAGNLGEYVRVVYTVGGSSTPTVTLSSYLVFKT